MRPIKLSISGLRSYRTKVEIDFTDANLIAIVGDTGAGKSSILEALFFALYGGCTWDVRAAAPLISDGLETMQVELIFRAEDRAWKVFRSASRKAAQVHHVLSCLDDPTLRFDGSTAVNDEIRRLVGLDYEAFLRTVVLPQGRFQVLLQASKTDRTGILKGIFRLERLEKVREGAHTAALRLRPGVDELKEQRRGLLLDPRAALTEAETRRKQAEAREAVLRALDVEMAKADGLGQAAERDSGSLQELVAKVTKARAPEAAQKLRQLAELPDSLDEGRTEIEARRRRLSEERERITTSLHEAEEAGEGVGALGAAASTIHSLRGQLRDLLSDEAELVKEEGAVELETQALTADEAACEPLSQMAEAARAEKDGAAERARLADARVVEARQRLRAARDKNGQVAAARLEAEKGSQEIYQLQADVDRAKVAVDAAGIRQKRAHEVLDGIRRMHAAAHAAEASRPGEPCPVCQRILPPGFVPPAAPGEKEAVAEVREADATASTNASDLATARAMLVNGHKVAREAEERARRAEFEAEAAFVSVREILPSAVPDSDDDVLLGPLGQSAAAAGEAHRNAETQARQLEGQLSQTLGELQARRVALRSRREALEVNERSVNSRRQSCDRMARGLPPALRPTFPLNEDELASVAEQVHRRQQELAQLEGEGSSLDIKLDSAQEDLIALDRRRRDEVDSPSRKVELALSALGQRLGDLTARLNRPGPPAAAEGSISERASWAAALEAGTEVALEVADVTLARLREELARIEEGISRILAEAAVADRAAFREAMADAGADARTAIRDSSTARDQIPLAAELDDKIGRASDLVAALDELWSLLSDNKFVAYVVARKQRVLLAVASELLGSMTGRRFGFSESFEIIDRLTGMPRGVKTLSGGETFLASLALGLGLVELAGRGGGRLDALFLDEGFGSLDANSLAEALEALMSQAKSGRLVAVISHLRSVAENMEHVLAVRRGPDGSHVHWLGGDERDRVVSEEIEAGLLS